MHRQLPAAHPASWHSLFGRAALALALCCLIAPFPARADDEGEGDEAPGGFELAPVEWIKGPAKADIGTIAEIQVPAGYIFTGASGTQMLMQTMQNPTNGSELGFLAPIGATDWFIVFEYSDIGYVKDDEKDDIDADALMESMKEGNEAGNKEREKRGWSRLDLVGWEREPHYDEATHNLEWGIRLSSDGEPGVNYHTKLLGRGGVMTADLVIGPDKLASTLPTFHQLLGGYTFKAGQTYAEFRSGDKIAEYGLTALIAGGSLAAAAKLGLLSKLWKPIAAGFVALAAFVKKLFGGRKREYT